MTAHSRTFSLLATALALAGLIGTADAQTDRALRVTVNKAEVVSLGGTASVVLVANPQIADVVPERTNLSFVLGKRPGEPRLYVYNGAGRAMLEREIVVVPQADRTVTVIRNGDADEYSCAPRCVSLERRTAIPAAAPGAAK